MAFFKAIAAFCIVGGNVLPVMSSQNVGRSQLNMNSPEFCNLIKSCLRIIKQKDMPQRTQESFRKEGYGLKCLPLTVLYFKKGEIMKKLFLAFLILGLSCSAVSADWQVYDAKGQFLGYSNDGISTGTQGSTPKIFNPTNGKFFGVDSYAGNLTPEPASVYTWPLFESNDCSGTPYVLADFSINYTVLRVGLNNYYSIDNTPAVSKTIYSYMSFDCYSCLADQTDCSSYCDSGYGCQQVSGGFSEPIKPLIKTTLPFTTPVVLPLKFNYSGGKK